MSAQRIEEAAESLRQGGVIAYPTEAVYGLGCDPTNYTAIERLLSIKQRRWEKGLILIAAEFEQLQPYLLEIDKSQREKILSSWPGPVTWLWPAKATVSKLLRGTHETIAVRVTSHPLAAALCREFGAPLVSTSANLSGKLPAHTADEVRKQMGDNLDYVLEGKLGGSKRPSEIRDALTGKIVREA
jgi:L-threonylcarbamoyladenylate synthase